MEYVIIGGDAAGMSAAMQIYKYDSNAHITIIERGEIFSYAQCGLPYVLSNDIVSADKLVVRSVDKYREKFGMETLIKHEVTYVDSAEKEVKGRKLDTGEPFSISYDKLLIATGANPVEPTWEGIDFPNVLFLKDIPDLENIQAQINDSIKNVTIIGGGYVGLEVAESMQKLGKDVTLINRGKHVAKMFDEDMAEYIHAEAKKHGIQFVTEENTLKIVGENQANYVVTDKQSHETNLVIVSIGIKPNTEFLHAVDKTSKGAIIVNEKMETNIPHIYAAGDCATQYHRIKKENVYYPLGTNANKQGRVAGMNMVHVDRAYKGTLGTSILKFMDLSLGKTGLSERDAKDAQYEYGTVFQQGTDIANYYPGAEPIYIKLVFEKSTRKLLGGQIIGKAGVDKRIDVLAVVLHNEMTIDEIEDIDLSYAPPFNSVWDPLHKAARKA